MKRLMMAVMVLGMVLGFAIAGDSVDPVSITHTNARTDTISYVNATEYYRGSSVVWTNCMLLTTGGSTQGLDGCAVQMKWGLSTTSQTYNATISGSPSNKWNLALTCPTNWEDPYIEIKVTDGSGNSYIYPWMKIHTKASL